MKLIVKYHGELAEYFSDQSGDKTTLINISDDDSIISVMGKYHIPSEKINLILVNGVKVDKSDLAEHRFTDGDTLAVWPTNTKE